MIVTEKAGKKIDTMGEIVNYKTTIDPKNLDFITTLLSSTLYSNPEQSFIREIVSNAWDSHIEAHHENEPIIIKIDRDEKKITIRDFGIGLSPERFETVFCSIGSSTKRNSNKFIGAFGIGRYSALACTDTVKLVSYYEGVKRTYIMYKNVNSIITTLLDTQPTEEKNGLEMSIRVNNLAPYDTAINNVMFFPNLYVSGSSFDTKYNRRKIVEGQYYKAINRYVKEKLLIGNVLYSVDATKLSKEASTFITNLSGKGIVLKFDIGELPIIPNREAIIYTEESVSIISGRALAAEQELYSRIDALLVKDFVDLPRYIYASTTPVLYNFMDDSIADTYSDSVIETSVNTKQFTYNGIAVPHPERLRDSVRQLPTLIGAIKNGFFANQISPYDYSIHDYCYLLLKPLIIKGTSKINEHLKKYLKQNYDDVLILGDASKDEYIEYYLKDLQFGDKKEDYKLYATLIYEWIYKVATILDVTTDPAYLTFLKADRQKKAASYSFFLFRSVHDGERKTFPTEEALIKALKDMNCGVLLVTKSEAPSYHYTAGLLKFRVVLINEKLRKKVLKANLSNVTTPEQFIKDPKVRRIYTINKNLKMNRACSDFLKHYAQDYDKYAEILEGWNNGKYSNTPPMPVCEEDSVTKALIQELNKFYAQFAQIQQYDLLPYGLCYTALNSADPVNSFMIYIVKKIDCLKLNSEADKRLKNNRLLTIMQGTYIAPAKPCDPFVK